jgi:aminomethyltransferase
MADAPRRTPLYDEHQALGARLVPFAGYEMPIQYAGISAEHEAVRTRVGVFDVSHMGELELSGEHAAAVVNYLVTNDLDRIDVGQAMYTCCCNAGGTILDDLIVYKRSHDEILVVCNASNRDKIAAHFKAAAEGHCEFRDVSDDVALIAVQGPHALAVLTSMGATVDELKPFRFSEQKLAGADVTVARTGYTGEDGAEIFVAAEKAAALWRALFTAGKDAGIAPAGLGARDTLRLEARLSLYGNDIDETTNPLEAGLGWTVKFDADDFTGKQALLKVKEQGVTRKMVGFEMVGRGIARHGYPLLDGDGKAVGICTSGSPSPTLAKNIGLGYLPPTLADVGTAFRVDCRGKHIDAVVVKTPFYKRPK